VSAPGLLPRVDLVYRRAMTDFTFQCPHCGKPNAIGADALNQPTVCNDCGLPYLASVPAGRLMVQEGEDWKPASTQGAAVLAEHGEKTVLTVNPAVYRQNPIQTLVLTLALLGGLTLLLLNVGQVELGVTYAVLAVAGALVSLVAAMILVSRFVNSRFESLTITSQRSIWARGLINRRTSEVQHDDIRNIQVQQSLIERLVRAGTVSISSAGQDDMEIVAQGIPNPHRVLETIRTYQRRLVKGD